MLEFELEIMFVGIWTEANLLDYNLAGIGLHFLGLLFLLVEILLVIKYLAYRRIGLCTDFHEVKFQLVSHLHGLGNRINSRFSDVVAYETNLRSGYLLVDVELIFILLRLEMRIRFAASRFEGRLWR